MPALGVDLLAFRAEHRIVLAPTATLALWKTQASMGTGSSRTLRRPIRRSMAAMYLAAALSAVSPAERRPR